MSHFFYRNLLIFSLPKVFIRNGIYKPLGFFKAPSNLQLMLIGMLGMSAMVSQVFIAGSVQGSNLGGGDKFLQAFYPLAYVPYCIFVKELLGSNEKPSKIWLWLIGLYSVVLLVIAMGTNSRSSFFYWFNVCISIIYILDFVWIDFC